MEFTKEELEWIEKTRQPLGDPLDELNQRVRSYVGFSSMSVNDAQKRTLEDFRHLPGIEKYAAIKDAQKEGPFFVEKTK